MKRLALIVIAIVVVAAGWFLLSPLFIDVTVDEELDAFISNGQFDMDSIMSMPEDERRANMDMIMEAAASVPDEAANEPMPAEPTAIATGVFTDADAAHKGSGQALLYALGDGRHLVRFENFRTTNGPDLYVYLAKHPAPTSAADVTEDGFIELGKLKGNVGNQNYVIPADVDIDDYGSVVIWCKLFGVLFSPAALTRS